MAPAETDLHMHTVYSDGASEPEALLQALVERGIKTVAVTDHDTMWNTNQFPIGKHRTWTQITVIKLYIHASS